MRRAVAVGVLIGLSGPAIAANSPLNAWVEPVGAGRSGRAASDPNQTAAVKAIMESGAAQYAEFVQPGTLWIFMDNEGKDYDSVAAFFCRPLAMHHVRDVIIHIWDAPSALYAKKLKPLGKAQCP